MHKIASPQDLQHELRRLLMYSQSEHPSRSRIASELQALGRRVAEGRMAGVYSLTAFKSAVRHRNYELIKPMIEELRKTKFSEREIFRLALAGDPELDQDEWSDILGRAKL